MYRAAAGEDAVISYDDVEMFRQSLEPIMQAGKMGALLAQFPPSFLNNSRGQQLIEVLAMHFGQYRLAVELRHRSWSDDPKTADFLRQNNIAWVQIDEPKFQSSIAAEIPLTADTAYFRFHGRNAEMWWKGDVESRYCYHYSPEEIRELAAKVKAAAEKTSLLFAFFNNHWQGYAPKNATDMKKALQLTLID
jgi:uncharacterized protein YecE (DUF72 family)